MQNAFLLTEESIVGFQAKPIAEPTINSSGEKDSVDDLIFTSDKPIPPHVSNAIEKIKAKGIPVNKESLRNHIPWDKISTEQRIKCTDYLNEMGASK